MSTKTSLVASIIFALTINCTFAATKLPSTVTPIHYDLTLEPNAPNNTFSGSEVIQVLVNSDTDTITLNSLDLNITEVCYKDGRNIVIVPDIKLNEKDEQLTLSLPSKLKTGDIGNLSISFQGTLRSKTQGMFQVKVGNKSGIASLFAPNDARRAFPCWDEPSFKSTFQVTVTADVSDVAISNMPIIREENVSMGKKRVTFDVTPVMCSYLVAVVIGDFEFLETTMKSGVVMRVYTWKGKVHQGKLALEDASQVLPFFEDYFNASYPLPKMDLIAVPNYPGGMENWGAVEFIETILTDSQQPSYSWKTKMGLIVAHELGHQWFGNLVTTKSWNQLWLNDGFASFIEYLCVDHLHPEYAIWNDFITDRFSRALKTDALHNSHAIDVPDSDDNDDDISIFDYISYDKGSSIIRMIYEYLGHDIFKQGIQIYINRHQYKNTEANDIYKALEEVSGKNVSSIMNTWTKQKGFPLVSVSFETAQNGAMQLSLKQEYFSSDGDMSPEEQESLWKIPITIAVSDSKWSVVRTSNVLLSNKTEKIILNMTGISDCVIKVNPGFTGFYRVQYEEEMMKRLLQVLPKLSSVDQHNIQDDLFALAQAGKASTIDVFQMWNTIKENGQNENLLWESICSSLNRVNTLLSHTDFQKEFHSWAAKLLLPLHKKLGWEAKKNETQMNGSLRQLVLNNLAAFNEPNVIQHAKQLFDGHVNGTSIIPSDIRASVYSAVARTADEVTLNKIITLFRKSDSQEEKTDLLYAMAVVNNTKLMQIVLNFSISQEVESSLTFRVICKLTQSGNKGADSQAWKFFKDNSNVFRQRYGSGYMIPRLVACVTQSFANKEMIEEIQQFFHQNPFSGTEASLKQALEEVRINGKWLERDSEAMKVYFNQIL